MSITDFIQMLRDTGGQIVLTYDTAAVQAAFRYAPDGRTPPCAMIDAIYITDQKSNLLEIFDMNLYSTSYHTRGREEKKEDVSLTDASTGRVRTLKLDESKLIPWFQPTGSNMTASTVMNSDPLSYHAVLPNTDNSNARCVFMTDLSITGTPLFNRWFQADIEQLERDLAKANERDSDYYIFKGPGKSEIHPDSLLNFLALTEYHRMKDEDPTEDEEEVCIEDMNSNNSDIKQFKIHKKYMQPVVYEKFHGKLDRQKHLLRLDHPIHLVLTLKDKKADINSFLKRMEERAKNLNITEVFTSHQVMIAWDPWYGKLPGVS